MSEKASQDPKQKRRIEIEEAAFQLLLEKGYKATSMLAVARRAKASNETLYRWYGNKQALFLAIVKRNAAEASTLLAEAMEAPVGLSELLDELGPKLLQLVLGERAVALNRAAAADVHDTATLGKVIVSGGREAIERKLASFIARAVGSDSLPFSPKEAAAIYLDLLIGDRQVRRIIGVDPPPSLEEVAKRSARARDLLLRLLELA